LVVHVSRRGQAALTYHVEGHQASSLYDIPAKQNHSHVYTAFAREETERTGWDPIRLCTPGLEMNAVTLCVKGIEIAQMRLFFRRMPPVNCFSSLPAVVLRANRDARHHLTMP
jgi:hypothetical protein